MPSLIGDPKRFKKDFEVTAKESEFPEYGVDWYEAPTFEDATQDMAAFFMARAKHLPTFTNKLIRIRPVLDPVFACAR